MRTKICSSLLLASLVVAQVPLAAADDKAQAFPLGAWKVTAATVNAQPIQDRDISGSEFVLTENELQVIPGNGGARERFKVKQLAGTSPPAIEVDRFDPPNRPQRGIMLYEIKGEKLRIAMFDALKQRPMSFEPQPKLLVLELHKIPQP